MKKAALVILFIIMIIFFNSCYEAKEINDMTIISGASFDLNPHTGEIAAAAEIASGISEESDDNAGVLTAKGKTIAEAMKNLVYSDTRETWISHAQSFVISEDLAISGISPVLDYAVRNYEARLSVSLVVFQGDDPAQIWDYDKAGSAAFKIEEMLLNSRAYSGAAAIRLYQAVDILNSQGINLTIPVISLSENSPVLNGTAIFAGDRLRGTISQEETLYLLLLLNRVERAHMSLDDGSAAADIQSAKVKLIPSVDENGDFSMRVDIKMEGVIAQLDTGKRPDHSKEALEQAFSQKVEEECLDLVAKLQNDYHSDVFGFGRAFYYKFPDEWAQKKELWDEVHFAELPVAVNCRMSIDLGESTGQISIAERE